MTANPTPEPRRLPLAPRPKVDDLLRVRYPHLREAIDAHPGTDDPVYQVVHPPEQEISDRQDAGLSMWLPAGYHWGLHIEHKPLESAGPMTQSDRHRGLLHSTVSPWMAVDAMHNVLDVKRAAPQLLLGGRPGLINPVLIQHMPLDIAGRALEHPAGTPETNRAACVQIEICWGGDTADLPEWILKALANVFTLVDHRYNIAQRAPVSFEGQGHAYRMTDSEWAHAYGYYGHEHVPNNVHWDVGAMRAGHFMDLLDGCPVSGYDLSH